MDEAQQLADRVAVMRAGEIIALGRPDELGGRDAASGRDPLHACRPTVALGDLPALPARARDRGRPGDVSSTEAIPWLRPSYHRPGRSSAASGSAHFSVTQPTLEDIYLELTGDADGAPAEPHRAARRSHA